MEFCYFDTCFRCFNSKWIHWTADNKEISGLQSLVLSNQERIDCVRQKKNVLLITAYLAPCIYCHYPTRKEWMCVCGGGHVLHISIWPSYSHSSKMYSTNVQNVVAIFWAFFKYATQNLQK